MAAYITSAKNPRIRDAIRLRDARHRRKQGRILIDGVREISRALAAGIVPAELYFCESLCQTSAAGDLLRRAEAQGAEMIRVAEPVLEKLAFGNRTEGMVAVAPTPDAGLAGLSPPGGALIAVLEGVEKPGNVGAVLRSADAAGLSAVIVADGGTDLFNPNAIRASLGTIFTVPVAEATSEETLRWLNERKFTIFAARVDGAVLYTEADYTGSSAVVFGSESKGLSDLWASGRVQAVRLPMLGAADSLNVSVTAAVIFYEAIRQRGEV